MNNDTCAIYCQSQFLLFPGRVSHLALSRVIIKLYRENIQVTMITNNDQVIVSFAEGFTS